MTLLLWMRFVLLFALAAISVVLLWTVVTNRE
jgi:hypothetical protein